MKKVFLTIGLISVGCFASSALAQETAPSPENIFSITKSTKKTDAAPIVQPTPPQTETTITPEVVATPTPKGNIADKLPSDVSDDVKANRRGQMSEEEAAILPYYNNFLSNYYLGPEDIISVEVFGQPNYSKLGITVPPTGKISYPLIREGVRVAGKSVEQVADEITKKLDEFIIDPKVTVTLDKAVSARFSVLGDVGRPGIYTMTRRLSVYEAIAESGGILRTGKKQVVVLRRGADGKPYPMQVNLKDIETGKVKEEVFLVPGDQIIVPGNKIKMWQNLMNTIPVIGFARTMTGF